MNDTGKLITVAGVVVAVSAFCYNIGYNAGEERNKALASNLALFNDFKQADFPRITTDLNNVLNDMKTRKSLAEEVKQANDKAQKSAEAIEKYKAEIERIKKNLADANSKNAELLSKIETWNADSLQLSVLQRESVLAGKEQIAIGVKSVNLDSADVVIAGEARRVNPGDTLSLDKCSAGLELVVTKIDYSASTVIFTLLRRKKS